MPKQVQVNEVVVDDETYVIQYLGVSQALKICAEVAKRVVPLLGSLVATPQGLDMDLSEIDFGSIAAAAATAIEPDVLESLIKQLCSVAMCKGGSQNFDEQFRGRPGHALKVAVKSFEVNCGDFFAAAVSLAGSKKAVTTQES